MKTTAKAKTKLQIIDETVKFYSQNERCVVGGTCLYWKSPESQCAVGRALDRPKRFKDIEGDVSALISETYDTQAIFKPEYRGHDIDFWQDLQTLHDDNLYWDNDRNLSERGKVYVKNLKARYKATSRPDLTKKTVIW